MTTETKTGTTNPVFFPPEVNAVIAEYRKARVKALGKCGMNKGEILVAAFLNGGAEWLKSETEFLNALADQGKNKKNGKAKP